MSDSELNQLNDESSDSESITCEPSETETLKDRTLLLLDEGSDEHVNLKHFFLISIGILAERCSVLAIRRLVYCTSAMGMAQLEAFKLYVKALADKNGGNPNLNLGWYGTSLEGVRKIVKNGFGSDGVPIAGPLGFVLSLYGGSSAANCVLSTVADANGFRHLIFCRVILGKTKLFLPDAKTRVLPLYVLTVHLETQSRGSLKQIAARPHSPWISFTKLVLTLSKCLSSSKICLMKRFHIKFMEGKISRLQLVTHLRKIVGDELLMSIIRKFYGRGLEDKMSPLRSH